MFGRQEKEEKSLCPLVKGPCVKAQCMFWTRVRGKHPQTGADMDFDDCAVRWLPVLLIENSKETRQAAAAVESMRNESRKDTSALATALLRRPIDMGRLVADTPALGQKGE